MSLQPPSTCCYHGKLSEFILQIDPGLPKSSRLKRQKLFKRYGKDSNSYKQLRNIVQQEIRSTKRNYYQQKVLDLENTGCRKWWGQIRSLAGQGIRQDWSCQFLDDSCPDTRTLANKVNDFFISLSDHFIPLHYLPPMHQDIPPDLLASEMEVYKALSTVKTGRAVGPDFIPNKIPKEFATELAPVVKNIFNSSMVEGCLPDLLNPIPKVSPPSTIESDLRPIALTCTLAKVMEGFVRDGLVDSVSVGLQLIPASMYVPVIQPLDALVYLLQLSNIRGARLFLADFSKKDLTSLTMKSSSISSNAYKCIQYSSIGL